MSNRTPGIGDPQPLRNGKRPWRAVFAALAFSPTASAAELEIDFIPDTGLLELSAPADPLGYYILRVSPDLGLFTPLAIDLGTPAPLWEVEGARLQREGYFRLHRLPLNAPADTDGDGIDDVWELERPGVLDPLDPTDAALDPDGDGVTFLGDYLLDLDRRNAIARPREVYSREVTTFNFGAPTSPTEAISLEVTVYNGETPPTSFLRENYSREVTVFNYGAPTAFLESVSREVTVFNFGAPPSRIEAVSREVTVYQGEAPPTFLIDESYSREITVFNDGAPTAETEAISREVTVFNSISQN